MPFSMEWMRDRYLVMMRSGRARLHGRFERTITFDPTIGSQSNFYWSFRMHFSMERMRDRYSVMMRSLEPALMDSSKGHNFRFDRWIAIKLLREFPDEGSILGDDEVWSSQASWTGRKDHNFRSDRWIAIKLLLEFPDALFHGVDEESILGDDEVWSSQA